MIKGFSAFLPCPGWERLLKCSKCEWGFISVHLVVMLRISFLSFMHVVRLVIPHSYTFTVTTRWKQWKYWKYRNHLRRHYHVWVTAGLRMIQITCPWWGCGFFSQLVDKADGVWRAAVSNKTPTSHQSVNTRYTADHYSTGMDFGLNLLAHQDHKYPEYI